MSEMAVMPAERVIADPLRFKQRLRIGRRAFRTLMAKDLLQDLWDTAGVAWTGAAVAKSSVVATTFFAPTGIAAWLGLATAATPAGWVVAAAVGSAGLYYCATRGITANERFVDEIPRFINTPLDLLGASLFDLMGALALRAAWNDGQISDRKREVLLEHFVSDWGYDEQFVTGEMARLELATNDVPLETLARKLAEFQAANRDCNGPAMRAELMTFVEELVRADGVVGSGEMAALEEVRGALARQSETLVGSLVGSASSAMVAAGSTVTTLAISAARKVQTRVGAER